MFVAAPHSFVGLRYVLAAGLVPTFSVSVAVPVENRIASGCFGRRSHSHDGRVKRRGIGFSRTAARQGSEGCEGLAPHPFAPRGCSGIALVSRGVVCIVAFGSQRSAASRRSAGDSYAAALTNVSWVSSRLHLTALREHFPHAARGERVQGVGNSRARLKYPAYEVVRRRSPRAERTGSAAGEPEPLAGRQKHPEGRPLAMGILRKGKA